MQTVVLVILFIVVVAVCRGINSIQQKQNEIPPSENRIRNSRNKLFSYLEKVEIELVEPTYNDLKYITAVEQSLVVLEKAKIVMDTTERCSARFLEELDGTFESIDQVLLVGKIKARQLSQGV